MILNELPSFSVPWKTAGFEGETHRKNNLTKRRRSFNMTFLRNFWNDEQGQDLIEYTLLMAFVALASAALFLGAGGSIKGIWSVTNSQLSLANSTATS
jgi:Flp pilus assembly pilin Flp